MSNFIEALAIMIMNLTLCTETIDSDFTIAFVGYEL